MSPVDTRHRPLNLDDEIWCPECDGAGYKGYPAERRCSYCGGCGTMTAEETGYPLNELELFNPKEAR